MNNLHRQMSRSRALLNHCLQTELSEEERAALDLESAAAVEAERARQAEAVRLVVHPVIEPVGWRFRVMRRYRDRDHGDLFECIGEARTLAAAEAIARKEHGAAFVFEIGKQRFFNFRPTEIRA